MVISRVSEARGHGDCGPRAHAHARAWTNRENVDPGFSKKGTSPRTRGSWPCMQPCPERRRRLSGLGLHDRCYFRRWRACQVENEGRRFRESSSAVGPPPQKPPTTVDQQGPSTILTERNRRTWLHARPRATRARGDCMRLFSPGSTFQGGLQPPVSCSKDAKKRTTDTDLKITLSPQMIT